MVYLCMNASATDTELGESLLVIWSVLISTQWINFQPLDWQCYSATSPVGSSNMCSEHACQSHNLH